MANQFYTVDRLAWLYEKILNQFGKYPIDAPASSVKAFCSELTQEFNDKFKTAVSAESGLYCQYVFTFTPELLHPFETRRGRSAAYMAGFITAQDIVDLEAQ
ncbi:hypothetical protein ABXV18_26910 [Vibrio owensii]|uniref:hypothetical protein n=1 Tax=Vibrio owensii TaxID=696485 RepID=UPI0033973F45